MTASVTNLQSERLIRSYAERIRPACRNSREARRYAEIYAFAQAVADAERAYDFHYGGVPFSDGRAEYPADCEPPR